MGMYFEAKRFLSVVERVYTYVTGSTDTSDTVGTGDQAGWVTGETVGTKRGMHVITIDSAAAQAQIEKKEAEQILNNLLLGTLPKDVYDEIRLVIASPVYTYSLYYLNVLQIDLIITDPLNDYTTSYVDYVDKFNLLLEDASSLLLETSDLLLLEDN